MKKLFVLSACAAAFLFAACSIKAPEVRLTGEMTALQRDVLGTYQTLEQDTWMIASTRSASDGQRPAVSDERRQVLQAMRQQKFNKDDIDEFKQKEYVGENNLGFLEIRENEQLKNNEERMIFVIEIVTEENDDREIILNRVIELKTDLQSASIEDIKKVFAQMYQDNSARGTWIQREDGQWVKK